MSVDPIAAALENPVPAPVLAAPGESGPDRKASERPPLSATCPVRCLGMTADITGTQRCYYLDTNGQLVGLEAGTRHGKNSLIALFGPLSDWLEEQFPQWSKPVFEGRGAARVCVKESEIVGFDQAEASRALIEECARRGIFDPSGKMRGRGAHPVRHAGQPDAIMLHYGDTLLIPVRDVQGTDQGFAFAEPGLFDGHVYPSAAAITRPHHSSVTPQSAIKLLQLLQTWHWKRPLIDARFVLGGIGASMIGGALPWRPNLWITGGAGTGKSTLNGESGVLDLLLGEAALRTGNASAAAIRQTLKNSTVPVFFDEIEASDDNRRVKEVVELARVSSSGATMHRGGQDHQAHEFTLRSCFWFSSINIPPIDPQDRSRLGILELKPFKAGAVPPVLSKWHLPEIGKHLQRRMIDGWTRMGATYAKFQEALSMAGHTRRACDQFGMLLTCADILLNDEIPDDEEIAEWAEKCAPRRMAEVSEAEADHEACLRHLTTSMVQARGGDEREALGSWVGVAVGGHTDMESEYEQDNRERAVKRLQEIGLKLVNANWLPEERAADGAVTKAGRWGSTQYLKSAPGFLAVANSHQALSGQFSGTKWQGGVWRQSLARTPGAVEPVKMKFGRLSLTAVLVPLSAVLDESELPPASHEAVAAEWMAARHSEGAGA